MSKPLIDRQIWDATQTLLGGQVPSLRHRSNTASGSLLAGLITDDTGGKLIAAHACKAVSNGGDNGKVRYRYYVSQSAHHVTGDGETEDYERWLTGGLENVVELQQPYAADL